MLISSLTFGAVALAPSTFALVKGIDPKNPPYQSEAGNGQVGWNNCSTTAFATSMCQDTWLLSLDDFCLWAPPKKGKVGDEEQEVVSWCLTANHGSRLLPQGVVTSATLIRTPNYIQIKGTLSDQTKLNIVKGDYGGELDPHGYNSYGNPIGGLLFADDPAKKNQLTQVVQWISFIGNNQFCSRGCYNSNKRAFQNCMHIYDEMGCDWVMPNPAPKGVFQECQGDPDKEPGIITTTNADGSTGTSTWWQGESTTPSAYPPAATSNCVTRKSLSYATYASSSASKSTGSASASKGSASASNGKVVPAKSSPAKSSKKTSSSHKATKTTAKGHHTTSSKHHKSTPKAKGHGHGHGKTHQHSDGVLDEVADLLNGNGHESRRFEKQVREREEEL